MPRFFGLRRRLLRALLAPRGATVVSVTGPDGAQDLKLVSETRRRTTLLMQDAAALQILACVRAARRLGGAVAEAGVFAGGSARLICEAKGDAPLHLFDVFETLQDPATRPPAGTKGEEVRAYFGRTHTPRAAVEELLAGYPSVHFHPGVFPDSAAAVANERFSFVHLDLDLKSGTLGALRFFHPRLLPGGIIVGDDYQSTGVRRAFDTYFSNRPDTLIGLPWGQVVVVDAAAPRRSGSSEQPTS